MIAQSMSTFVSLWLASYTKCPSMLNVKLPKKIGPFIVKNKDVAKIIDEVLTI